MSLPHISGSGTLVADPDGRFSNSGTAITNVNIACNSRVLNKETNKWEDGEATYIRAVAFKTLAENINDNLHKGSRVTFSGQLVQKNWEDKEGNKRTSYEVRLDDIGPSLMFGQKKSKPAAEDPWGSPSSGPGW